MIQYVRHHWPWWLAAAVACVALTFASVVSRGPDPDTTGYHEWEHRYLLQSLLAWFIGFGTLVTMAVVAIFRRYFGGRA